MKKGLDCSFILSLFFLLIFCFSSFNCFILPDELMQVNISSKDQKPTLHMIGLFHTMTTNEYSHCAFTGKVLKFSKMMQMYDWKIIEYGNVRTESGADEFVQMLNETEFKHYLSRDKSSFTGDSADVRSTHHSIFQERLIDAMEKRLREGDIVLHPFGMAHPEVVTKFTKVNHGKKKKMRK